MGMDSHPATTPVEELEAQLEHPSAEAIWARALEVFGDEEKARSWIDTPRDIFAGRSPRDLAVSGTVEEQRWVLQVLLRIDYGVFS
jgi:uncharacterized protein (DUF2384 family)